MEFTKLSKFLNSTLNLLSIDCFSFKIGTIEHVIGEEEMINYKELHKEVIEEVYKNLSIIQPQSVPIYFHEIFKTFEKYETKKEWEYRPHLPSKMDHYYWEFREVLVRDNQENEELMEIYNFGFRKYLIQENSKKRLVIIERLKGEIEEIRNKFFQDQNFKERKPVLIIQPSNTENELFFEEATKIQISYKEDEGKYIILTYNGFDEVADFQANLISHYKKVQKEILDNLLVMEENKAREDYLKRLRFKCLHTETYLLGCAELFLEGGKLSGELENWELGIEGYIYEEHTISVKLPEKEFTILNEKDFLGDCYEHQIRKLEGLGKFIFTLCQNQQIDMNVTEDEYLELLRNKQLGKMKENKEPLINRIKWKGTPGEFGAIFDLLIGSGFIEQIKDKKRIVNLLHSFFEIRNEKGKIISENYLYRCFTDKMKVYPNGYLKIPFSDNYYNDK